MEPITPTTAISLVGVLVSGLVALIVAILTSRFTLRNERSKRQGDLALKIAELVSSTEDVERSAAMRRFAVGIVKIVEPESHPESGNVYFIPMNSRVTVGRDIDNDIALQDADRKDKFATLSRWHCGFFADQERVWIDDYKSTNGTLVNGTPISCPRLLKSEDEVSIGQFKFSFRYIRKNTILSQ